MIYMSKRRDAIISMHDELNRSLNVSGPRAFHAERCDKKRGGAKKKGDTMSTSTSTSVAPISSPLSELHRVMITQRSEADASYNVTIQAIYENIARYQRQKQELESKKSTTPVTHQQNGTNESSIDQVQALLDAEYAKLLEARMEKSRRYKQEYEQLEQIRRERKKAIQERQKEYSIQVEAEYSAKQEPKDLEAARGILIEQLEPLLKREPSDITIHADAHQEQKNKDNEKDNEIENEQSDEYGKENERESENENEDTNGNTDQNQSNNVVYNDIDDDSLLLIPAHLLGLFLDLDIKPPVCLGEVEKTLDELRCLGK